MHKLLHKQPKLETEKNDSKVEMGREEEKKRREEA
jgi:hypothetical protein